MPLADFIESEMGAIANWEALAATRLPAAEHMQALALRLHPRNCGYTGARHAEKVPEPMSRSTFATGVPR
jgi:hypothetical protein